MYISFEYIIILIPALILTVYAQSKVLNTFKKYSSVRCRSGMTGAEAARRILNSNGIYDVEIQPIGGSLTDNYDPSRKVLRLSQDVYGSTSLAAVGVAAHESGHAIQHSRNYAPLRLRSALVPLTNLTSRMAMPFIVLGILFGAYWGSNLGYTIVEIGIIFFAVSVVFSLVTLPVEFNASRRAVNVLQTTGIVDPDEVGAVRKVLSAAALTYVAAAATAVASLLRLILIFGGRRRN